MQLKQSSHLNLIKTPQSACEPHFKLIDRLLLLFDFLRNARKRPMLSEPAYVVFPVHKSCFHRAVEPLGVMADTFQKFAFLADHELCRSRRSRSAEVGNEVGDGKVDLVTDGRYDRDASSAAGR